MSPARKAKEKAGLLIAFGSPKDSEKEEPKSAPKMSEELDDKADAMRDLKEALDGSDYEAAALAFKRAYELCAGEGGGDSDDDEEDERY